MPPPMVQLPEVCVWFRVLGLGVWGLEFRGLGFKV